MTFCRTLALTAAACLLGGAAVAAGITVHDARNRDVVIGDAARIVSIGGAITEILYALGFEDRLVGVDSTSLYPAAAREKPDVGYMRQLSAEGVLGLNPSLVLAAQGSGPKETMDVLEAAKVPLVLVPESFSEAGLLEKIRLVGHAMDADKRAECLIAAVSDDLAQLRELRAKVTKPVRVMFVMSLLNGRAMAAGKNTAANEIIALAGGVNAIDGYDGYKIINDEAIVAAKPDVVLSIQRGKDSVEAEAVYVHPAFALTPVAANKTFISMEGLYLLGFGPRTAAAARDLSIKLYPALAPQAEKFKPAAFVANCRT
ncbi:heme/hemin ABC transporter substrate-binding protein [Bradyrhizobium archetypum]|uniref:Hemin ABC transporter substrate-binding protein n=1 Tax=Bradyrhizobium archetypum TaxID=2721160 RepID=A0A7Y4H413_9BRAD|nr:hemin ABC transporter substrate-binding protein [Bradyrhizobium archetypum]NOJ47271.1 hemin ABC transporter substrate-binding protein [Bradyrhizobium archetypum]